MIRLRHFGTPCLLLATCFWAPSCAAIRNSEAKWSEDATGTYQFGISTGWAFVETDVTLENGTGPLANPASGGSPLRRLDHRPGNPSLAWACA